MKVKICTDNNGTIDKGAFPMIRFRRISYIILAALATALLVMGIVASARDDGTLMHSVPTLVIFSIYALLQILCLALYDFGLTPYKIGFYLLHLGILVMLVGFLSYVIAGEYYNLSFSVGEGYDGFYKENGDYESFGFGISVDDFTVEKYEDGSDKYYRADLVFSDGSSDTLEVNKTLRRGGYKIYLMDYSDGSTEFVSTFGHYKFDRVFSGDDWYAVSAQLESLDSPIERIFYYSRSAGGYISEGISDTLLSRELDGPTCARVLINEGKAYVYVNRLTVSLAFKKDPGEYAVIVGMCAVLAGVVMTCLVRPQKKEGDEA